MTGYGEASAQVGGAHFFVEVRSLNSKYFKATVRLPEEYQGLEAEMEQVLRTHITRGTVTVNARCADATETAAFEINAKALNRYLEQIKAMPKLEGVTPVVDTAALLSLPGVLQPPTNEEERFERARSAFIPLLQRSLTQLIGMRDREGKALLDDLEKHRTDIGERLVEIIRLSPQVIADYETRLKGRIETLLKEAQINLSQVDLIREIAVYAERTDIAEETKRLAGHLDQFRDLLCTKDVRPVGRTLDFLAQEMLRETNTIASKSPDAAISRAAVEVKGAIDRIKEQAQNVE
jgi:uncharacterized protein (TIGR00255 family)